MDWIERLGVQLQQLKAPTVAELREALQAVGSKQEDIAPYIAEPGGGRAYGRNVVYRSNAVEAIVIHLPPGAQTAIHDHGESVGCTAVVEGGLSNVLYRKLDYGMASETGTTAVRSGQSFAAPHGQIHRLRNDGSVRMLSLHLYSPPLVGMRCYLPEEEGALDYVI